MKILLLTEFFLDSDKGEINGGVEARCFFVSNQLKSFGHQVRIIFRPASSWTPANWQSLPQRFIFTARMIIQGVQADFDIVEGTNYTNHLVAVLLGVLKQKPVICWYADVFAGEWIKNVGLVGVFGELAEWILFKIPFVNYIAISNAVKSKLVKNGVPDEKISVVYCGVNPIALKQSEKFDVCAVSRLLNYKHIDDLVAISKDLKVAIVGQGPEELKLKQLASQNVNFFGFVKKHEDVLKIMSSSKVFCHPSTIEGFGIVVIEALSLGVPAVVCDIPVMREITHNGQGVLFFEPKNREDLSTKLQELLTDKKLYLQKVAQAKKLAKEYSWEKISLQTEKFYKSFLLK